MVGYKSAGVAYANARRMRLVGLTGPGQVCGPVELPDGSYGYWTAHTVFDRSLEGELILPGRRIPGEVYREFLHGLRSWEEVKVQG